ncbi:hypothetical protein BRADI_2g17967v3 [Brachypodium distachyon]|uniref:Uncharacterized protein n=1 Tax=Brachypodium distachyon TaxID=15368 RepID=A0A0Q3G0Q2_BRADI|nr:hypothetical protein BRADI_2g17967v3 [Brachypodium distachyon]
MLPLSAVQQDVAASATLFSTETTQQQRSKQNGEKSLLPSGSRSNRRRKGITEKKSLLNRRPATRSCEVSE